MKKHHALSVLVCAFALVLAAGSPLLAGDQCCVSNKAGQCAPCDPASMHAASSVDKAEPAGAKVLPAAAGSVATKSVQVVFPDGTRKLVALPMSLFAGSRSGATCGLGPCGATAGAEMQEVNATHIGAKAPEAKAGLVGSGCGRGACVPSSECEGHKCKSCPPGACGMTEGASASSVPSDI